MTTAVILQVKMLVIFAFKHFLGMFAFMAGHCGAGSVFFNCFLFYLTLKLLHQICSSRWLRSEELQCHSCISAMRVMSWLSWEVTSQDDLVQTICSCQGHLWEDNVLLGSEYHRWKLHSLSGQPVSVFYHPHSKSTSLCSDGIFHVSVSAHCLLS